MPGLTIVVVILMGGIAGCVGAVFGLGGGVFLVPLLVIVFGLPIRAAVGISLATVIATSSAVSARTTGRRLINLRLGMVLEMATAAGGLAGGLTAQMLSDRALRLLFGLVVAGIGVMMLTRIGRRNVILDPAMDPGRFGGRFFEEESGGVVTYRVQRLPVGLVGSFLAGNVSSLLGIGGGIVKVPILNAWCGVPLRAAAATSAFMIGVTAVAAAPIYYARGEILPHLAGAAVLGALLGTPLGVLLADRARARSLKATLAVLLFVVSGLMIAKIR